MNERMSSVDAAWFRMDRAENTADVVGLMTFERLPPFAEVQRLVEERMLPFRRFRQRAVRGSPVGGDSWEDDPVFALEHHLVRHTAPAHDAEEALRQLVGEVCSEPLDPARPLWRMHYVEQPGGGGALVTKIHHCLADGFALVGLLLSLSDDAVDAPESRNALEAYRRMEPWVDPGVALRQLRQNPLRAVTLGVEAGALGAALARMAALPAGPPTRLSRRLTGLRRAAWSSGLALEAVRAAGKAQGATVNDVIVAAVAGALRGHLEAAGEDVDRAGVRAMVPVNLRPGPPRPDPETMGNRFGLVYLDLPTDVATPEQRIAAVRIRTEIMKRRPDAVVAFGVMGAVGLVPVVERWAFDFFCRKASIVMTNVPGPRKHLHLLGHRLDHMMFWVPHPNTLGVGISVLSYAGEVRIGVRADVAVIPDPADVVARFEREVAILGASPHAAARREVM